MTEKDMDNEHFFISDEDAEDELHVDVARNAETLEGYVDGVVEDAKPKSRQVIIMDGSAGVGKSILAGQVIQLIKEKMGDDVIILHHAYDDPRNALLELEGSESNKLSSVEELSAASTWLGMDVLRKLINLEGSDKPVIVFIEAIFITGKKVDMGYGAVELIKKELEKRKINDQLPAKFKALVILPTDEVSRLADTDRKNAWSMRMEEFLRYRIEQGIRTQKPIDTEEAFHEHRRRMGTVEHNRIVRRVIQRQAYRFQRMKVEEGTWPLVHIYSLKELEEPKHELAKMTIIAAYVKDQYARLGMSLEDVELVVNRRVPKGVEIYYYERPPRKEKPAASLVVDKASKEDIRARIRKTDRSVEINLK